MSLSALDSLPVVTCPPGCVLIEEGQPLPGLFFLVRGEVEVIRQGVLIAEIHEAGAVLGEMSWLLNTVPTATVRTLTPCTFRRAADPGAFLRQHPEVALQISTTLARRIDSLSRYLVDIKTQFKDRADHLGMIDEVLDALLHKHPRHIPRRATGD
jgi:CRP-like cAMP-binding protein